MAKNQEDFSNVELHARISVLKTWADKAEPSYEKIENKVQEELRKFSEKTRRAAIVVICRSCDVPMPKN